MFGKGILCFPIYPEILKEIVGCSDLLLAIFVTIPDKKGSDDMTYLPLIAVTEKSGNMKTGPILTTKTEKKTCPKSCPFYNSECYARFGPLSWHWKAMEKGENATGKPIDTNWKNAIKKIKDQKPGSIWRYGEAGDLPGENEKINFNLLRELVKVNEGKRGFGYTHKYNREENHRKIKFANDNGFTINLSANNPDHADQLLKLKIGPVTVVLPHDQTKNLKTKKGKQVIICPNVTNGVNCLNCKLCAIPDRRFIIGFPAHGPAKKRIKLC
jgi:hypothetical protein